MGYFLVMYDSIVIIYDHIALMILTSDCPSILKLIYHGSANPVVHLLLQKCSVAQPYLLKVESIQLFFEYKIHIGKENNLTHPWSTLEDEYEQQALSKLPKPRR